MYTLGIDAGSRAMKIVLMKKATRDIIDSMVVDQEINQNKLAIQCVETLLTRNNLSMTNISHTVATGYGRDSLELAKSKVTEITCHGYGVYFLHRDAKTVIDIGGQDSKVLHLGEKGKVAEFSMNDRCAAGTGRFLEVVSERLQVPLLEMGKTAESSSEVSTISSMCVVFAETEIIGLLAQGVKTQHIIAGVTTAIAQRLKSMAGNKASNPIYFTGGVSLISGMENILSRVFDVEIRKTKSAQLTGAIGAALIATTK